LKKRGQIEIHYRVPDIANSTYLIFLSNNADFEDHRVLSRQTAFASENAKAPEMPLDEADDQGKPIVPAGVVIILIMVTALWFRKRGK
jgi:hypothetical protein